MRPYSVADFATRIRNGYNASRNSVTVENSNLIIQLIEVIEKEGFITTFNKVGVHQSEPELKPGLSYFKVVKRLQSKYADVYQFRKFGRSRSRWVLSQLQKLHKVEESKFSNRKGMLQIILKYHDSMPGLASIELVSKPSRRVYLSVKQISKKNLNFATYILSTDKGTLTAQEALRKNIGGEVLLKVT